MKRSTFTPVDRSAVAKIGLICLVIVVVCPTDRALSDDLVEELRKTGFKLVHESWPGENSDLVMVGADGSNPVNLTRTPQVRELYPKVSPEGKKIAFLVDQRQGESIVRSAFVMNIDGTGRRLIARGVRWLCWSSDGKSIAYLKSESDRFSYRDATAKELVVYDLATAKHRNHPNPQLHHLYNICWSPDTKWFLATVSGGMGYKHTNLAVEAEGTRVVDLGLGGCRPDISPDGKRVAWGCSDWVLRVGDLDLSGPAPKVTNQRDVVTSARPLQVYHVDWSPDGKYLAFSRGAKKSKLGLHPALIGIRSEGWNLCVADVSRTNRYVTITSDGMSNKEPDWIPLK